jgi:hypothetical protein
MRRDVLLVGSVGMATAEDVFRIVASTLGARVKRIPDGETGWARSVWTQCQRPFFMANPALEMVEPDPTVAGAFVPARVPAGGIYAHTMAEAYRGRTRLRPGFSAADVRFDNVGYADWALESYSVFKRLKLDGVIASQIRFQVSVPDPAIILNMHVWPDAQPAVAPAYTAALFGEIERLAGGIPPNELAIQWDCTQPVAYESADSARRSAMIEHMRGLAKHIPDDVEVGYHLCYGDFEHKHGLQPPSLAVCVEIANGIVASVLRRVDWFHMPVPRDRDDLGYVEPLRDLQMDSQTRLFLGLVHYTDGLDGTSRRMDVASAVYPDFGIATECGFGRRVGQDIHELLRIHAQAADLPLPAGAPMG